MRKRGAMTGTVWIADPQDFSKGQGGFQGGYFNVHGVTDRDHESLAAVCAIMDRRKRWRKVQAFSGFDAVYQWHDGRPKWVGIRSGLVRRRV